MSKTMLLLALSIILLNSKSGNHRHHSCEVFREYRVLTTIETFGIASDIYKVPERDGKIRL